MVLMTPRVASPVGSRVPPREEPTTLATSVDLSEITGQRWERQAACRGKDPSVFFGPNRFEPNRERLARESAAKTICGSCPVTAECREMAVVLGESFGVWGGLGEKERKGMKPARRAG